MKPSKELFYLIKSLTKSEKRYFKLMSSLQTGDKNYMKLFECIDELEDYDEEAVKEKLKNEKFIKHLPSEKNHLYKLILKSLRSFILTILLLLFYKKTSETLSFYSTKHFIPNVSRIYNELKELLIHTRNSTFY